MSKSIKWQYNQFVQSRKEKLANMLISEIIFLKKRFKEAKNRDELEYLSKALDKLDYLLNRLKNNNSDMSEEDFDKVVMLIYQIFKEIADCLDYESK
jgi:hypothetical protein